MSIQNGQRTLTLSLLFFVLVLSLGIAVPGLAQDGSVAAAVQAETAPNGLEVSASLVESQTVTLPDGRLLIMLELSQPPAAVAFAQAGGVTVEQAAMAVAQTQQALVDAEQATVLAAAQSNGIVLEVRSDTNFVMNSVTVAVAPEQLSALLAIPGVIAAYPVTLIERDTSTSIPHVGAVSAWNGTFGGNYTGEGIVISIIDDGIDYTHRNMGGDGTWTTNAADRATLADGEPNFGSPTDKVIGGFDYVGDRFNGGAPPAGEGLPAVLTETPDPDPIACSNDPIAMRPAFVNTLTTGPTGHGTHVAGIAAGIGVNADGSTYNGSYSSVPFNTMKIGPGAAPEAQLIAMKVFGCFGSAFSSTIASAIDDSVSGVYSGGRRADIINMSLGSGFGTGADNPALTPYVVSIENATLAGTLVVTSAGNSGDTFYITGAPGSVGWALSVSNSDDGNPNAIQYFTPSTVTIQAAYGGGPGLTPLPLNGLQIVAMLDAADASGPTTTDGCTAATNASALAGNVALIDRGTCTFVVKVANAQAAGAVAVIIHNSSAGVFGAPGGTTQIPMAMITFADGNALRTALASGTVTTNLSLGLTAAVSPAITDTVVTSTSRGPRRADTAGGIKPDVSAPGGIIISTGAGTGTGVNILGGTSMSAPTVAGMAALLLSNPDYAAWTPMQLKALIMNTANNDIRLNNVNGVRVSPQRVGTGRIDVEDAMSSDVIAFNATAPYLVGVNFGVLEVPQGATQTFTRQVTLRNLGAVPATYNLSIDTYTNSTPAVFSVSPSSVTVPAFGQSNVTVTLTVTMTGASLYNQGDPATGTTTATTFGTLPRHYLSEEGAILNATPTSGATVNLRVPLYAAPRPSGDMRAEVAELTLPSDGGTVSLPLDGTHVATGGAQPAGVSSIVTALPLAYIDLVDQPSYAAAYDIEFVGVDSNFTDGGNTGGSAGSTTGLYFGVAMADEWSTFGEFSIRIYLDIDENGTFDYVIFSTNLVNASNSAVDVFYTAVRQSNLNSGPLHLPLNGFSAATNSYLLNNNVVVLAIAPGVPLNYDNNTSTPNTPLLGVGNTDFNYYVETFSGLLGTVDTTPVLYYDMANPTLHVNAGGLQPSFLETASTNLSIDYDITSDDIGDVPPGVLLLHHHNDGDTQRVNGENFRRAEVVRLNLQEIDVGVFKFGPAQAAMGSSFTYELDAVNFDLANTAQVIVTDQLPTSLSFVSASAGCTHDGSVTGGQVTCALTLPPGSTTTSTITVQIVGDFAGTISNTAEIELLNAVDNEPSDQSSTVTTLVPLGIPTPVSPVGLQDVSYVTPDFVFGGTPYAEWYHIWISGPDSDLPREAWYSWADICAGTFEAQGTCTISPSVTLDPAGQYSWWIRAWKGSVGYGTWSNETQFYYPTGTPTAIAPIGNITDTTPEFSWNVVTGATWYQIWVSAGGAYVHAQWYDQAAICTGGVCTVTIPPTLAGGAHSWFIRAWSPYGLESEWTGAIDFYVVIPLATPTLIAPAPGVIIYGDQTPDFSWNAVDGATWYELWVETQAGVMQFDQWYDQAVICTGGVCTVNAPATFAYGFYRFYVQAWAPVEGYSGWSTPNNYRLHPPL